MKPGFSKKKQQQKKAKRKANKGKGDADGDDKMADAAPQQRTAPSPEPVADGAGQLTAKDKQRQRMELKKALKVQVASLKSKRNKLTKLAGNRTERRQLNTELKGLVHEQLKAKGSKQQQQQSADAPAEDVMAE